MSRPLFEYITKPEKTGLSRRTKIILLVSVILLHAVVLFFLFTARMPIRIVSFGPKVYSLKIVPPLPPTPSPSGPQGQVVGGLPAGGPPAKPARPAGGGGGGGVLGGAQGARVVPPGGPQPPLPSGTLPGVPSTPFSLKVPVKPGPIGPEELRRGVVGGTTGAVSKPTATPKLWSYTQTDAWGRTPIAGSGPASAGSPGGPLGSPYELMSKGTGPQVIFKGNPSAVAQGYNIGPWAREVVGLLQKNWELPAVDRAKSTGQVGIAVVIEKSGRVQTIRLVNSPSAQILVGAALNAITRSQPLPPLPADYPGLVLEAYLLFDYHEIK